ncbi:MAG: DUF333 domain-containing protein, partial [Anaerolineaceae bacterium]|nr:DUF333 domain-containing protein [Anaerolineaceae bacterium]
MSRKLIYLVLVILFVSFLSACGDRDKTNKAGLPNPASVVCEENGGKLEIVTAKDGSQSGKCIFNDGSFCDEWAFYRSECKPGDVV